MNPLLPKFRLTFFGGPAFQGRVRTILLIIGIGAWSAAYSNFPAHAGTWYWDSNGGTAGAGASPSGTWGTSSFWTQSSAGTTATSLDTTTSADTLYFVASPGTNSAENPYTVTVSGSQSANALLVQSSGSAALTGGTVNLWGGGINVSQYAYGTTSQGAVNISSPIVLRAGQTWSNNSSNALSIYGNVIAGSNSLTIGGIGNTNFTSSISGSSLLTMNGAGTWTLTGSNSTDGLYANAGATIVAGTGSLTMSGAGNLFVSTGGPASITVQDAAALKVGGAFYLNYTDTAGGESTLTLTGGTFAVTGNSFIGYAAMRTGPGTTSAAFYQSGGIANLAGAVTVGYLGTATNLLDVSGGSLTAPGGLVVDNQGNGLVNIHGSGIVNVTNGLVIGQDASLATAGSVSLSSGTLAVTGNLTLGGSGLASFTRSGGALSVTGSLSVDGHAQMILDGTVANVSTTFSRLTHTVGSTLVVVPETGNFASSESLIFTTAPALSSTTNGIIGPWAVLAASGTNSSGDYLTTSGSTLAKATYVGTFAGSTSSTVVSTTSSSTLTNSTTAYAVKFGAATTTLGSTANLTLDSGGMIFNGGTVTGGTITIPNGIVPMVYAGSSTASRIGSAIVSDYGLTGFGPGTLILSGSNSHLTGTIVVSDGAINVQNGLALGPSGSGNTVTVATGAALEIQGNTALRSNPITLNGTGSGSIGALCNVQDNNSIAGAINLGSNSQIGITAGTLTLTGPVQGNYALTKTGTGTLVLTGTSGAAFPAFTVSSGMVTVQSSSGLGSYTLGVTVNNGATVQLQGGISIANVPLTISGA
jgi:fibronectin-binding autotransporter adhesin